MAFQNDQQKKAFSKEKEKVASKLVMGEGTEGEKERQEQGMENKPGGKVDKTDD